MKISVRLSISFMLMAIFLAFSAFTASPDVVKVNKATSGMIDQLEQATQSLEYGDPLDKHKFKKERIKKKRERNKRSMAWWALFLAILGGALLALAMIIGGFWATYFFAAYAMMNFAFYATISLGVMAFFALLTGGLLGLKALNLTQSNPAMANDHTKALTAVVLSGSVLFFGLLVLFIGLFAKS